MRLSLIILSTLLLTGCTTAKLAISSSDDFITKLKAGRLTLTIKPLMELDENSQKILMARIRLTHPEFQNFMFNSYNYQTSEQNYSIYYNWYNKHCELRISPVNAENLDLYSGTEIGLKAKETINPIETSLCFAARKAAE